MPQPPAPPTDPDEEWFTKEGVTDPKEKEAIKARARVLRYADHRRKLDEKPPDDEPKKKWYE